jgi:hypothetical protein
MGTVDAYEVASLLATMRQAKDLKKDLLCIPLAVDGTQLIRVIVKYLKDNPKDLHNEAGWLTYTAIDAAYPCE